MYAVIVYTDTPGAVIIPALASDRQEADQYAKQARADYDGKVKVIPVELEYGEKKYIIDGADLWKRISTALIDDFGSADKAYKAVIKE